jgi:hypothetical protein
MISRFSRFRKGKFKPLRPLKHGVDYSTTVLINQFILRANLQQIVDA